jgi:hypothetical protein
MEPFSLAYVRVVWQQVTYANPSWSGDGQRFVQNEMMLGVDRSGCFNGLCCGLHFGFTPFLTGSGLWSVLFYPMGGRG